MDFSFDETEFCDPADWNAASYNDHPIDSIEPLFDDPTPYRTAAIACLRILGSVDRFMAQSADPRLAWVAVSCTLELTSTSKLTEAEIARQIGVSEQSVRRATAKFVKLANFDPGRRVSCARADSIQRRSPPSKSLSLTHNR
jgi:hypothetical protein